LNPLKWLLKKLGLIEEKKFPEAVRVEKEPRISEDIMALTPRKIRGFKPKTAYEKRLWKQNAKLEEGESR